MNLSNVLKLAGLTLLLALYVVFANAQPNCLNCPGNISVPNDPGLCGATVNYPVVDGCEYAEQILPFNNPNIPPVFTNSIVSNCDDCTETIALPFTFTYYGVDYNSITISSNGFISFSDQGNGCCSPPTSLPDPFGINNFIALWWTDLDPGDNPGGGVRYGLNTDGDFLIQYYQVPHWPSSNPPGAVLNGSLLLKPSGVIEARVLDYATDLPNEFYLKGIENQDGSDGISSYYGTGTPPSQTIIYTPVTISQSSGLASGSFFPVGTTTNTFVATDENGAIVDMCSFNVTVIDTEAPVYDCVNGTLDVFTNECQTNLVWTTPIPHENCELLSNEQTGGPLYGSPAVPGVYNIQYTAEDVNGNVAVCDFTINVIDTEDPIINNCPFEDQILEVNSNCVGVLPDYTVRINVDENCNMGIASVTQTPAPGSTYAPGENVQLVITATDNVGNSSECLFNVSVEDNEAPTVICTNIGLTGSGFAGFTEDFSDNNAGWILGPEWEIGAVTNNGCNNWCSENPTSDNTSSADNGVAGVTLNGGCDGDIGVHGFYWLTSPVIDASGVTSTLMFEYYRWLSSDYIPYRSNYVQIYNGVSWITIQDLSSYDGIPVCDDAWVYNALDITSYANANMQIRFGWNVSDDGYIPGDSWNIDDVSVTELNPSPQYLTLDANGEATITAADIDGGSFDNCGIQSIDLSNTDFDCNMIGANTVVMTVTDENGNSASCISEVIVVDELAPVLSCNDLNINLNEFGHAVITEDELASATDNCGIVELSITQTFFDCSNVGDNLVTVKAVDGSGNTSTCEVTVTVNDVTNPIFVNCPPTGTVYEVNLNDCVAGLVWNIPVAQDNCQPVTVEQTGGPLYGDIVEPGFYTIIYTATDDSGNTAICSFDIEVIDSEDPNIINCPFDDQILEVNTECVGVLPDYTTRINASDNCGPYTITQNPAPGTTWAVGDIVTVTITVTDDAGNSTDCIFDVLVQDNTLPTAICQDMSGGNAIAFFDFETGMQGWTTGNDEFTVLGYPSIPSSWTLSMETGGCEPVTLGSTWFGTPNMGELELDCEGGGQGEGISIPASERSWILSPLFDVGENIVTINFDSYSANESGYPESYDVEHVQISINGGAFSDMHGFDPNLHEYSDQTIRNISYMAMVNPGDIVQFRFLYDTGDDCCGDYAVTGWYLDNILISGLASNGLYVYLDENGEGSITADDIDNGSYDNCGIDTITLSNYDFTCDYIGANTIVMTVTDVNGNTASCQTEVIVADTLAPVVECNNLELTLNEFGHAVISIDDVILSATDNCEIVNYEISQTFFDCSNTGDNIVTLSVYDASGNVGTCESIVTIIDPEFPFFISCPPTINVDAPAGWCSAYVNFNPPTVQDNCEFTTIEQIDNTGLNTGDLFPVGKTQLIFVATDLSGQSDTCIVNIFVNDYHTPPVIACPADVAVTNDPFECGAVVNGIGLTVLEDNCPLNVAVLYEITDEFGAILACGVEDASGTEFPVGTSTVTYTAQDQPVLLITEVDQSGSSSNIVFINELHYDNSGTDVNEFIEIAGGAGTDLSGYSLVLYNGSNGTTYNTIDLSGVIADQSNGLGAIAFNLPVNGLQNGSPDGLALVSPNNQVLYFLSYEGSFEATNGPAAGMMSTDIGVSEASSSPIGESLQLIGTGSDYPDFSWSGPAIASPGAMNIGQTVNEGSGNSIVDLVEITNFGPASMDIACLLVSRVGASAQTHMVEGTTILQPGETYVAEFEPSVSYNTPSAYTIGIEDAVFDVVALNGYNIDGFDGDLIPTVAYSSWSRIYVCDHDDASDWEEDYCGGSMGFLNPGLPVFPDNGWLTSLQSELASEATCNFDVTVVDEEGPTCTEFNYTGFVGPTASIEAESCTESSVSVNVGGATMYAVQIENLSISYADMGDLKVELISPEGTALTLFESVCEGTADAFISLSDTSNIAIPTCAPYGGGNWYAVGPNNPFKSAFFNENANGIWTLKVTNYGDGTGSINGYTLIIQSIVPYSQTDVTLENEEGECTATFDWLHPVLSDNCCDGQIIVTYTSDDAEFVPQGGVVQSGEEASEVFAVGTTTVLYTLTDQYGNTGACSFDVTVLDTESPVILDCISTIFINLDAGECCQIVSFIDPPTSDNCVVTSITYDPPSGTYFCQGITTVTVYVEDAAGNQDVCQFNVIVEEFEVTQFELVCNDEINVSLDASCTALITADMLLEGNIYGCYDEYEVTVSETPGGAPIAGSPSIGIEYVNSTVYATVCDTETGNCCTTTVNVEDKLAPEIACPADITIECNADPYDLILTGEAELLTCETDYSITYSDFLVDYGTCEEPRAILTRTWTVVDQSGLSFSCDQIITIMPFEFEQMEFPAHLNGANALSCSDVAANPALTTPEYSGVPTIGGQSVYGDHYCDIYVGYWDEILYDANCEQGYSILRHWVVQNGCEPLVDGINPQKHIQNIIVDDNEAPNLEAFEDVTISTDNWGCGATYPLPLPSITDNCSPDEAIHVWYSSVGGVIINDVLYINSPALGKTATVTVYATDDCGNTTSESFTVTAQDLQPPVVVADHHTVVVLTTSGVAKLYAEDFDDGSYDGCGPIDFLAKRMDDGANCTILDKYDDVLGNGEGGNLVDDNAEFNEVVHFCCADIQFDTDGNQIPIMVQFMVCDDADQNNIIGSDLDNCNMVMIEVVVQDKLAPVIECPENVTINCIDYAALGDLNALSDEELNAMFGEAVVYSTCGGAPNQVLSGTEVCGSGVVNRIFTVTTAGGSSTCIQKIFVEQDINGDNFLECEDITFPSAPESQYNWCLSASNGGPIQSFNPITVNSTDCGGFTPQAPAVNIDDLCTEVGVNVTIDTFAFAGGGCFKYLVHWEVIDQCLFNENFVDPETGETNPYHTENGYFHIYVEYDVFDAEGPSIVCSEDVLISCNENAYAGPIVGSATDNCTEPAYFGWNWKLDVDNNFTIDAEGQGNAVPGPFPVGTHRIIWIVSDGCGNTTTENCVFSVEKEDNKAPTPYCFDGLSTAIMQPAACNVTLWAEDFNAGSFDDCGLDFVSIVPESDVEGLSPEEAYEASLNLINGVYGWTFDCSYIENGVTGEIEVRMYATDEAGNYDFCVASLRLDDNFDCCEDTGEDKLIAGEVYTEEGNGVADAMIEANTSNPEFPQYDFTDGDGGYGFENMPQYYDYELKAEKDVEYLNGVTTLDLVMIQKHILSLDPLNSPYKLIAADINGDCNITANDLLELRKLILGLFADNNLPNNQSWRFVDADYQFDNPNNPCPFDEIINVDNLLDTVMSENFIGVKIGDVNGTAVTNANMDAETRNATALTLSVNDAMVAAGQEFAIEFTSAEFNQVSGYQFTLGFNQNAATFVGNEAASLNVTESNFGLNRIDEGMITTSWGVVTPVSVAPEDVLFTLHFKATADLNISEFIKLNSRITPAEAYQGVYLDVYEMNLEFRTENGIVENAVFELYQNEPNPFDGESVIGFTLPEAGNATLTIYDVTGKIVQTIQHDFAKGMNTVTVNRHSFNTSGVLYYQLESGEYTATKKMIVLE